jgi:hypothetical protein
MNAYINAAARDSNIPHPTIGQDVFLVSTGEHLFWYGAYLGWHPAWNSQWGEQAYAEITANTATLPTSGGSTVPVPGLSIPFAPLPNRQYELEFDGLVSSTVNTDEIAITAHADNDIILTVGTHTAGSIGQQSFVVQQTGVSGDAARFAWRFTFAGTIIAQTNFSVSAYRVNGTGNCVLVASSNGITRLRILDLGPTGSPIYP